MVVFGPGTIVAAVADGGVQPVQLVDAVLELRGGRFQPSAQGIRAGKHGRPFHFRGFPAEQSKLISVQAAQEVLVVVGAELAGPGT